MNSRIALSSIVSTASLPAYSRQNVETRIICRSIPAEVTSPSALRSSRPGWGLSILKTKNPATGRAMDKYVQVLKCGELSAARFARLLTSEHLMLGTVLVRTD